MLSTLWTQFAREADTPKHGRLVWPIRRCPTKDGLMLSKARLFLIVTLLIGALNLRAASKTVWQIGNLGKQQERRDLHAS